MIDVSSSKPLLAVAGICTWTAVLISIHQVRKDWLAVPKEEDRKQVGGRTRRGKRSRNASMVFRSPFPSDASRHSKLFFDLHLSNNNKKKRADRPAPPALHGTALPALYRPHRLHGPLLLRHELLLAAVPGRGPLPRHRPRLLRGAFFSSFFFLSRSLLFSLVFDSPVPSLSPSLSVSLSPSLSISLSSSLSFSRHGSSTTSSRSASPTSEGPEGSKSPCPASS
jgi:hypothetical protein